MSVKSPRQREEVCPLAPSTKLALASSLKRLLQKKFLDDITVKEIVEDCEVNRQTFYYHFQDIYDLLHWFLDHETVQVVQDCPSWQEALMAVFRYIQENHMIIYHILIVNCLCPQCPQSVKVQTHPTHQPVDMRLICNFKQFFMKLIVQFQEFIRFIILNIKLLEFHIFFQPPQFFFLHPGTCQPDHCLFKRQSHKLCFFH